MKALFATTITLIALFLASPVLAKEAAPLAEDPVVEQRLIHISEELRCLVCQNQAIAGSDAGLAKDLPISVFHARMRRTSVARKEPLHRLEAGRPVLPNQNLVPET